MITNEAYRKHYEIYLKSEKWGKIRNEVLERDGNWCQDCEMAIGSEVHHLTYKNIFKEEKADLITLCPVCHGKRHNIERCITDDYEAFVYEECRRLMGNENS